MNVRTSVPKRSFYYDGKAFSLLDQQKGFYGQVSAPATIDETLDKMERDYGIAFPIEDILVSKPFGNGAQNAQSAQYLGIEPVLGVNCHHLAFQYEAIDWQAWIEDGPVAVVRKVVITSKSEENAPQLTALLSNWDFTTLLPDFIFAFDPPLGSAKIEVLLAKEAGTDAKPSK